MNRGTVIDTWIVFLLAVLLLVPASKMFVFKIAGNNIFLPQLIHVIIIATCFFLAFVRKVRLHEVVFALLLFAFLIITTLLPVLINGIQILSVIKHLSVFSAFFAAVACLVVPIKCDLKRLGRALIIAILSGLTTSLVLYFIFPNYVSDFRENVYQLTTEESLIRLMWDNGVTVFVLAPSLNLIKNTVLRGLTISFIMIGWLLVMNRTIMAGLVVYSVLLLHVRRREISLSGLFYWLASFVMIIIFFNGILFIFPDISATFVSRFFGGDSLAGAGLVRWPLYEQYLDNIAKSFPYGLGLGVPVANLGGLDAYYTDVSLLTFLLPLGLPGFCFCVAFIILLYRRASSLNSKYWRQLMTISIIIYVLISLNVDIFSRNNAVIVLAVFVSVLVEHNKHVTAEPL
jgi:hypothetical protein